MNRPAEVLWRRLDQPGHDACRLAPSDTGWVLCGTAVFREGSDICQLRYTVLADESFQTREATVQGWSGATRVDLRVSGSAAGEWGVNGSDQPQLTGCLDLDLGFTPATNLLPVRRLALAIGEAAEAPAAYLAFPELRFEVLPQRYKRLSSADYEYEAATAGYRGTLVFSPEGFVEHYPGLFARV